jgi:hypothetical protein
VLRDVDLLVARRVGPNAADVLSPAAVVLFAFLYFSSFFFGLGPKRRPDDIKCRTNVDPMTCLLVLCNDLSQTGSFSTVTIEPL